MVRIISLTELHTSEFSLITRPFISKYVGSNTHLELNGLVINENLYVAHLENVMLIGLDFMTKHKAMIDMNQCQFCIQNQKVSFVGKKDNSVHAVVWTQVRIERRTVLPARLVLGIQCTTNQPLKPACYLVGPDVKTVIAPVFDHLACFTFTYSFPSSSFESEELEQGGHRF